MTLLRAALTIVLIRSHPNHPHLSSVPAPTNHPSTIIVDSYQLPMSGGDSAAGAALSLRLERDNPCNTTILDPDGNIFYTVATDFSKSDKPVTRVHDGIGKLVAEWIWRDARSDLLTIRDRPQAPASAWLKKSIIPFREFVFPFPPLTTSD